MRQKSTWVIVANGEMARVFDMPARHASLVPIEDHVWAAPEMNEYSDSQGMSHSSMGASQHRMSPRNDPGDLALEAFARMIGQKLSAALRRGDFERLIVAAAPGLMGHLRGQLDTAVRSTIWLEIDKDFTNLPIDRLGKALEPHLYS